MHVMMAQMAKQRLCNLLFQLKAEARVIIPSLNPYEIALQRVIEFAIMTRLLPGLAYITTVYLTGLINRLKHTTIGLIYINCITGQSRNVNLIHTVKK